jgi:hypothetical protein
MKPGGPVALALPNTAVPLVEAVLATTPSRLVEAATRAVPPLEIATTPCPSFDWPRTPTPPELLTP